MSELLTLAETRALLKVSERFLREHIGRGLLPVVRLSPRAIRIRQSDLDAWIADHVEGGPNKKSTAEGWTPTTVHIGSQRHGSRRKAS